MSSLEETSQSTTVSNLGNRKVGKTTTSSSVPGRQE